MEHRTVGSGERRATSSERLAAGCECECDMFLDFAVFCFYSDPVCVCFVLLCCVLCCVRVFELNCVLAV